MMSICNTAHFAISLPCRHLAALARPARTDPAEKGRTGATPPFLPLYRQTGRGVCNRVCNNPTPLFQGSLPSHLSLREGSGHGPQAGADAPEASPMKNALSDPDLWRAVLLCMGFPLPALPHARQRSGARSGALSHPQLLRLDRPLVLRRPRRRPHCRRACSYLGLAGLVRDMG